VINLRGGDWHIGSFAGAYPLKWSMPCAPWEQDSSSKSQFFYLADLLYSFSHEMVKLVIENGREKASQAT
jgi:hypothetical protein